MLRRPGRCWGGPLLTLSTALAVPLGAAAEQTQRHQLLLGGYYSRGDYGETRDTEIYYLPLGYEYRGDGWRLHATVPWLRIAGPGTVLVNIGGISRPDAPREDEDALLRQRMASEGLGDVSLAFGWELPPLADWAPFVDFGVELKLPTAEASAGLGTGATDIALQFDLYHSLSERTLLFATLGYRLRGPSDYFEALQDGAFLSGGFSRNLNWPQGTGQWRWGMMHDYRQAASALSRDTHELLPYLAWQGPSHWSLMLYAVRGFGRDTAGHALGLQWGWRW